MVKNSIVIAKKIPNSLCLALEKWNSGQRSGLILMIYLIPFHRQMKKQGHFVQSKTSIFHSLSLCLPIPNENFQVTSILKAYNVMHPWKSFVKISKQENIYPSSFTRAGIPPDLKMASSPCLWCDRLCMVPAAHLIVSRSLLLAMALTRAETIWGEFMIAWREASFFESWCTIIAAWLTTTY